MPSAEVHLQTLEMDIVFKRFIDDSHQRTDEENFLIKKYSFLYGQDNIGYCLQFKFLYLNNPVCWTSLKLDWPENIRRLMYCSSFCITDFKSLFFIHRCWQRISEERWRLLGRTRLLMTCHCSSRPSRTWKYPLNRCDSCYYLWQANGFNAVFKTSKQGIIVFIV